MNVWKYKIISRVEQDISLVRLVRFAHSWDILANTLEINFVFPHAHVLYKLRFSSQSLTLSVALRCFIRFSGWIFFKNKKKMWRRMVWNLRTNKTPTPFYTLRHRDNLFSTFPKRRNSVKLRLHTAISLGQISYRGELMWFNGSPTKVHRRFLTNAFCYLRTLYNMYQDTKSARLIAVCKRSFKMSTPMGLF